MDAFGYLSVLLSIIVGLGITQVLTSLGRLIREREGVRFHLPTLVWALVLLLVYVQAWWAMFELRERGEWTLLDFLAVLAQAILLYLLAPLVLPEQVDGGGIDLREHYRRQAPWFFGVMLAALAASLAKDLVLYGRLPALENLAFHLVFMAGCVSAILVRHPRYHDLLALGAPASIAAYAGLLFWRLG